MRTLIKFEDVHLSYGPRLTLVGLSFDIQLGEFVYLVGRTGSGKSSILKMIYADATPWKGRVTVDESVASEILDKNLPFLRRKLGIVFQDFQLLPDRTVQDNIYFALQATGWKDRAKIKQRISEVLMRVGMSGKGIAMPHQLSGGEQQRVAIARALINDPLILIADEPTGNLDPEATQNIMEILLKVNRSGTAVLMATHEYRLIKQYPHRVLEVVEKKIRNFPDPENFLSQVRQSL
ncbi:MAG: ATP-binding cassette domain-containing protein [Bacteroidia bacterium]|nr:ATP-binding cassette domain-containing protein [Bacteroidia bacterium]